MRTRTLNERIGFLLIPYLTGLLGFSFTLAFRDTGILLMAIGTTYAFGAWWGSQLMDSEEDELGFGSQAITGVSTLFYGLSMVGAAHFTDAFLTVLAGLLIITISVLAVARWWVLRRRGLRGFALYLEPVACIPFIGGFAAACLLTIQAKRGLAG